MNDAPIAEWIEWNGGEKCPVEGRALVEVKFRSGSSCKTSVPGQWRWTDTAPKRGSEYDIVAYRLVRRGSS